MRCAVRAASAQIKILEYGVYSYEGQENQDGDELGDICDSDLDGDDVLNASKCGRK